MTRRNIDRHRRLSRLAVTCSLLAAFPLALAGCQQPDTSPGSGKGDSYPAPMNDPQISVLDPQLRQWVAFQPANIQREGDAATGRIMNVQVPVRNLTERQYLIVYRYLCLDAQGKQLEPALGWTFMKLDPKQVARLEGAASLVDARDYRLEVRWSR
jgi:hypothetical protein